jgi:hypothetical protein
MKNSNDTIYNRTSDLPICSTVPLPLCHHQRSPYSVGTGVILPVVKRLVCGVDLSLLSSFKVKDGWSCTVTPHACLHVLDGDKCAFPFIGYGLLKHRASRSHCTAKGCLTVNASDLYARGERFESQLCRLTLFVISSRPCRRNFGMTN